MKRTRSTLSRDVVSQPLADLRKKTRNILGSSGSAHIDAENVSAYCSRPISKPIQLSSATDARPKLNLRSMNRLAETTNILGSSETPRTNRTEKRKATDRPGLSLASKRAKSTLPPGHVMPRKPADIYGDQWMDKQERSFLNWINYEFEQASVTKNFIDNASRQGSLQHFTVYMEFERICNVARVFFNSKPLQTIINKVDQAIDKKNLTVQTDSDLCMDITKRQQLTATLTSFDARWLILALSVLTPPSTITSSTIQKNSLDSLIEKHIMGHSRRGNTWDSNLLFERNKNTTKRIFAMVLFLDHAKAANLVPNQPCLFAKNSVFKSSQSILQEIGRQCLVGEGDTIRHLSYIGYTVNCAQSSMDEYNYRVDNLAVDLRDGIRIARLIELHSLNSFRFTSLKVPANERADRIRNLELCFKHLSKEGLKLTSFRDGRIKPEDVVDGHRKNTLEMLWRLILHWKVGGLVNQEELRTETRQLVCDYVRQFRARPAFDAENCVYLSSNTLSLLLKWCQAVGAFYNIRVSNFTTSFADGSMFCYLIGHYHPTLLGKRSILFAADEKIKDDKETFARLDSIPSNSNNFTISFSPLRSNRQLMPLQRAGIHNYRLLEEMTRQIGGIPLMFNDRDFTQTSIPDEKVVITYVSYLCSRLLVLSAERRAAITIQRFWRRYGGDRYTPEHHKAAIAIQKAVRQYLERRRQERHRIACITRVQSIWRGRCARRRVQLIQNAITTLQFYARSYLARQNIRQEQAAILLQKCMRGYLARQAYKQQSQRIVKLQTMIRGYLARRACQQKRKQIRAATRIQAAYRRYRCVSDYQKLLQTVLYLQRRRRALIAMRRTRSTYQQTIGGICAIQALIRGQQARERTKTMLKAITGIQAHIRRWNVQQCYRQQYEAAVLIQKIWRGFHERKQYHNVLGAARTIQLQWRAVQQGRALRSQLAMQHKAATAIQACYRGWRTRYHVSVYQQAVRVIEQRRWETLQARRQQQAYISLKHATLIIQRRWRATLYTRQVRSMYLSWQHAAITVQRFVRGYQVRSRLAYLRKAVAVVEQRRSQLLQANQERRAFVQLRSITTRLQQRWRAILLGRQERVQYLRYRVRQAINSLRVSVRTVEMYRSAQLQGREQRHDYLALRSATIYVQRRWRAILAGRETRQQWQLYQWASQTIQRHYRGYRVRYQLAALRSSVAIIEARRSALLMTRQCEAQYQTLRRVVINMQRRRRATAVACQVQAEYQVVRCSIIGIQSFIRGQLAREMTQQQRAATCIQAAYRGHRQFMAYQRLYEATLQVQRRRRALLAGRCARAELEQLKWATQVLQSQWRARQVGHAVRQEYIVAKQAINGVQALIRGYNARQCIEQEREKLAFIVQLQAISRGYLVRLAGQQQQQAATCIAAAYRGHVQRQAYLDLQQSVIGLQTYYRAQCARQLHQQLVQEREERCEAICVYIQVQNAARTIQRVYRRRLHAAQLERIESARQLAAVQVLQFHARGWLERIRYLRLIRAIRSFQSVWRGYRVLRIARARIEKANANVQEDMRLINRTTVAIETILGSRRLTDVIHACIHLEVATRWSRECRRRLLDHNVVGVMLSTMSSCNQSAPHKRLLMHACRTLQHLATDPQCMEAVLPNPAAVDVMIDLLKVYQRKYEDAELFKSIAQIFLLITCEPQCCRPILRTVNAVRRMHEIHVLAKKRHEREVATSTAASTDKQAQLKKQAKALDMLGTAIGTLKDLMANR
ncbi:hypothetical protein BDF19DRAFT_453076 [Syncephalis fuscata]|nr:hypothetical protein BDF19DRAFT_453076 [Syncephalis fuscata]